MTSGVRDLNTIQTMCLTHKHFFLFRVQMSRTSGSVLVGGLGGKGVNPQTLFYWYGIRYLRACCVTLNYDDDT